jgi:hypothetical protein
MPFLPSGDAVQSPCQLHLGYPRELGRASRHAAPLGQGCPQIPSSCSPCRTCSAIWNCARCEHGHDPRALHDCQRHRGRRLPLEPLAARAPAALPAAGRDPAGGEPVPGDVHRLPRPAHAPRHLPKAEERACSIRFSELPSPVQRVAKLTGQREAIPMAGPPASQGRPPRDVSVAFCAMPPPARVASG